MTTKYQQFQEWLDQCPVEITNYKDYTDEFEVNFLVPCETEEEENRVADNNEITSYDTAWKNVSSWEGTD